MANKMNLIGQRFGKLTVISEEPKRGASPRWLCKCDCGNTRISTTMVLRRGDCNSCGCLVQEHLTNMHSESDTDIAGRRFGKLLALHKVDVDGAKYRMWLCQCDCGKTVPVASALLKSGKVKSCGCLMSDHVKSWFEEDTNIPALIADTLSVRNSSGVKGVYFDSARNKWAAEIMFRKKRYRLGRYDNLDDAATVRKQAEEQLHGDFLEWYKTLKEQEE